MKRTISVLGCILFAIVVMFPFGTFISFCLGYTVELISVTAFAIVTASLSGCLVVLSIKTKESVKIGIVKILFSLLTPLSFINAFLYMIECSRIWVVACVFICIGCCCYLTIKHGMPMVLKITALMLSALMVLPIGFFGFMVLIFGNIGQNTVVQSIESPSGIYYAEVIDSDQGALGGDTLVDVYENNVINAFIFKITKKPQRVYHGEWGEFKNMNIYWKDDNCLVINSVEYEID